MQDFSGHEEVAVYYIAYCKIHGLQKIGTLLCVVSKVVYKIIKPGKFERYNNALLMEICGIQEKTWQAKDELERCGKKGPPKNGINLGRG